MDFVLPGKHSWVLTLKEMRTLQRNALGQCQSPGIPFHYDVPFPTFTIFTIQSISRNIYILHSTTGSICFAYFYVFPPKCPSGSLLVMVTGANGSGRAVTGGLACCRCFWFPLLAWSVPRWHCHRSLGYLWQTVPARCLGLDREGRLFVVLSEKRVLGWSCCCLGHC